MKTIDDLPHCHCTACGHLFDAATPLDNDDARPQPGDISVCISCGHIMTFDNDLRVRELTDEERYAVAGNAQLVAFQRWRAMTQKKKEN